MGSSELPLPQRTGGMTQVNCCHSWWGLCLKGPAGPPSDHLGRWPRTLSPSRRHRHLGRSCPVQGGSSILAHLCQGPPVMLVWGHVWNPLPSSGLSPPDLPTQDCPGHCAGAGGREGAAAPAPAHVMPGVPQLWRLQMFPDTAPCPLGADSPKGEAHHPGTHSSSPSEGTDDTHVQCSIR